MCIVETSQMKGKREMREEIHHECQMSSSIVVVVGYEDSSV
jgi:hypothetical protein